MAIYTQLSRSEIDGLAGQYPIGQVGDVSTMPGGQANSSYVLTTPQGRFVLSVCDEKGEDEIATLTATLGHLNAGGFRTSRLIETRDGKGYILHSGKPTYMKEYIEGEIVDPLDEPMARQLGAALARLHGVEAPDFLPRSFSYGVEALEQVRQWDGAFPHWLQAKLPRLEAACRPDLPRGLVHGDIFCDNVLYRDGELAAILDFEEACEYFLVFDIGMCMAGCCCREGVFSLELAASLAAGYQEIRPLTEAERSVIKTHIAYGAAATGFWRYRQYNIIYPGTGQEMRYVPMMELAEQVDSMPQERFREMIFGG